MEPCELVNQWDQLTAQERLDELEALINDHLANLGYSPVTTEIADLDNALGDYENDNNHIRFDVAHLEHGDAARVINTAYHEMAHAMEYQDGDYDTLSALEKEQYNDSWIVDDSSDEGWDFSQNTFHPDIEDFADYMTGQALNDCQSENPSAGDVYGVGGNSPFEYELGEPVITDAPDDGDAGPTAAGDDVDFEIDFENAVFSSGGSNE